MRLSEDAIMELLGGLASLEWLETKRMTPKIWDSLPDSLQELCIDRDRSIVKITSDCAELGSFLS